MQQLVLVKETLPLQHLWMCSEREYSQYALLGILWTLSISSFMKQGVLSVPLSVESDVFHK